MVATKGQRRKKKLAAERKRKNTWARTLLTRGRFPEFVVDRDGADPRFMALVREAVGRFDFASLPEPLQMAYRVVRYRGAGVAEALLANADGGAGRAAVLVWTLAVGEAVLASIPEPARRAYLPFNDVTVAPEGNVIRVRFRSLEARRTPGGTVYLSRQRPAVSVGGRRYTVAWTGHAVERVCQRVKPRYLGYAALGDVFAFFNDLCHFEVARLADGQPAVTFFDSAFQPGCWSTEVLVPAVLGRSPDPAAGRPHYRVGYYPVALDGDLAVLKTFLFPGYTSTPEHLAILRADLPAGERERLGRAARNATREVHIQSDDLSLVRFFHEHGVPQVVQTHEDWFRYAFAGDELPPIPVPEIGVAVPR